VASSPRLEKSTPERRHAVRFPIRCDIRYRVLGKQGRAGTGTGRTINISSKGVLFRTERRLPVGGRIEVWINWPLRLNDRCALNLVVHGRIVRHEQDMAAVQIHHCEFRTRGTMDLVRSGRRNP
jgi:hypothetical protein